jgi:hypothetical protein
MEHPMNNSSKSDLISFLDYALNKGLVPAGTVRGWRAAVNAALGDIADDSDVSQIDVETELVKYNNRNPNSVAPDTLRRYKTWVTAAIQNFNAYRLDPMNYKPKSSFGNAKRTNNGEGTSKGSKNIKYPAKDARSSNESSANLASNPLVQIHVNSQATGITLTYPLRVDFRAQIVVPSDLNVLEAKRLGAFIMTLAQDFAPG